MIEETVAHSETLLDYKHDREMIRGERKEDVVRQKLAKNTSQEHLESLRREKEC